MTFFIWNNSWVEKCCHQHQSHCEYVVVVSRTILKYLHFLSTINKLNGFWNIFMNISQRKKIIHKSTNTYSKYEDWVKKLSLYDPSNRFILRKTRNISIRNKKWQKTLIMARKKNSHYPTSERDEEKGREES